MQDSANQNINNEAQNQSNPIVETSAFIETLSDIFYKIIPNGLILLSETDKKKQHINVHIANSYTTDKESLTNTLKECGLSDFLVKNHTTDNAIVHTDIHCNKHISYMYNNNKHTLKSFKILTGGNIPNTTKTIVLLASDIAPPFINIVEQTIKSLIKLLCAKSSSTENPNKYNSLGSAILNNSSEGIIIIQDEKIAYGNEAFMKIVEKSKLNIEQSLYELVIPEDIDVVKNAYNQIIRGIPIESFDVKITTEHSRCKSLLVTGTRIRHDNKKAVLAFISDITERRNTLDKLKQSEKRYRTLVNKSSDIFVQLDKNGNQVFISPVAERITGYTLPELERPFLEVIHPADHERVMTVWHKAIENPSIRHRIEYRHIHKTLGYIWVEAHGQSFLHDPQINSVYTFVRDISDRKRLENELKEQKHRYQMISENVSDVIWVYNLNKNKFSYISPSVKRLRGYTPEEAMAQTLQESLTTDSAQKVLERIKEGLTIYQQNPDMAEDAIDEVEQPCKDGKVIWIEASTRFRTNKKGEIEITGVSRNIDDKKATEKALRKSEQKYRTLIETMNEGIIVHNGKKIISFNNAACRIMNYDNLHIKIPETIDNKHTHNEKTGTIAQNTKDAIFYMCSLKNRQTQVLGLKDKDNIKWLKINATPLPINEFGHIHTLITFNDITLLKENEAKLENANATKDRFISIMAHDLRSPFNVILGYTELMNENIELNDFSGLSQMAMLTNSSALNAVSLLNNLLDWSRTQTKKLAFNPQHIDLCEVLSETTDFLENLAKQKNIQMVSKQLLCTQLYADKNMLLTILRNLISNAIKFSYTHNQIEISSQQLNKKCIISISDNGIGIPKKDRHKILSAEHTTSTIGTEGEKGTGLGLTVCREFVNKHNGRLWFESKENEGTTFFIELSTTKNE